MYKSDYFYLSQEQRAPFTPHVLSAWRISVDSDYEYERESDASNLNVYALIRGVVGTGQLYTSKESILLEQNHLIILPLDGISRYCSASPNWRYNWVNFYADNISESFETQRVYTIKSDAEDERIFSLMLKEGKEQGRRAELIDALFLSYYHYLFGLYSAKEKEPLAEGIINDIVEYINSNITKKITVSEIAKTFKMSQRRTEQIFASQIGRSPKSYICNKKADKVAELLINSTMSIKDIAQVLGYSSPYHLMREFSRLKGKSPRVFRDNNGKRDPLDIPIE